MDKDAPESTLRFTRPREGEGRGKRRDLSDAVLLSLMPKGGLINAEDIGGFLEGLGGGDNSAYVVLLDHLQGNMVTQLERGRVRSNGRGEVFNLNGIRGA